MKIELVGVDTLTPFPGNPRKGDVSVIAESLSATGQYRPIVVQASTRMILAGNHTWLAAKQIGWTDIHIVPVDVDDVTAKKIVLVDNRSADLGAYDTQALLDLLREVDDLTATGYTPDDLSHLAEVLDPLPPLDDSDHDFNDELLWPVVRARIAPDLYEKFNGLPGKDDAEKLSGLLA